MVAPATSQQPVLTCVAEAGHWWECRPTTLEGLFDLKAKYNDAKLIVGNTEVGIEMKFKSMAYPHLVGVTHIPELNRIEVCPRILSPGKIQACTIRARSHHPPQLSACLHLRRGDQCRVP